MSSPLSSPLQRFKTAQAAPDSGIDVALTELRAGRKTSHWIWYVFPQLASLGRSSTAKFYGITDGAEACDYLRDPELRRHLLLSTEAVASHLRRGVSVNDLMCGTTDALKLVSSLTLFVDAARRLETHMPQEELSSLQSCGDFVLDVAARQGIPRCTATLTYLSSV